MKHISRYLLLAIVLFSASTEAHARQRREAAALDPGCNVIMPCDIGAAEARTYRIRASSPVRDLAASIDRFSDTVLGHPPGCPHRSFCACGASVRIFGRSIRRLWPVVAWLSEFPKVATPAPGLPAIAPSRHHMVVLIEPRPEKGPHKWLVYDANSGRHQTKIHERSIKGYTFVNPRA